MTDPQALMIVGLCVMWWIAVRAPLRIAVAALVLAGFMSWVVLTAVVAP